MDDPPSPINYAEATLIEELRWMIHLRQGYDG